MADNSTNQKAPSFSFCSIKSLSEPIYSTLLKNDYHNSRSILNPERKQSASMEKLHVVKNIFESFDFVRARLSHNRHQALLTVTAMSDC